jgi:signal transduction histidine kinase
MTLGIDPADRHYLPRLQAALIDDLYRGTVIPQLAFFPVLLLLYLLLQDVIVQRPAINWLFVAILVFQIPRSATIFGREWLLRHYPSPRTRVWIFAIGAGINGAGLGLLNLMSAPMAPVEVTALLAMVAAGIGSVNIVSMNPSLLSYFMSMLPNFGLIPLVLLLGPENKHEMISITMVLVNLIAMVFMATYFHVKACRSIVLRLKVADTNVMLQTEIRERSSAEQALAQRNADLETLNERLADTQSQLLQSEKMASIGQLAAGVAHEINNPIAFVRANLHSLSGYVDDMALALDAIDGAMRRNHGDAKIQGGDAMPEPKILDVRFLREDIPALLNESIEGATRVEKIVKDLKEFSHIDDADWQKVDVHRGIDTTLSVAAHELKYKVDVVRDYGVLPLIECLPFQLNQVFLNLLVNAAQSIETHGTITISTGCAGDNVWIKIADTGKGIEPAHLTRIFEPFFTTKSVGVGTGLGLSVSYSIVRRHGGTIEASSVPGRGAEFTITLPVAGNRRG